MKVLSQCKITHKFVVMGIMSVLVIVSLSLVFQYVIYSEEKIHEQEKEMHALFERLSDIPLQVAEYHILERQIFSLGDTSLLTALKQRERRISEDITGLQVYFKGDEEAQALISSVDGYNTLHIKTFEVIYNFYKDNQLFPEKGAGNDVDRQRLLESKLPPDKLQWLRKQEVRLLRIKARYGKGIHDLKEYITKVSHELEEKVEAETKTLLILYYSVLAVLLNLFLWFLIVAIKKVQESTLRVENLLKGFSEGESVLVDRLPEEGNDEMSRIGYWFNRLMEKLQDSMTHVGDLSCHLTEVAFSAQKRRDETSGVLEAQIDSVHNISTLMLDMDQQIAQVAEEANDAASSTAIASENASSGAEVVANLIHSMNVLAKNVEDSAQSVIELDEHTKTIYSVITMIEDIAEQTNLLALNAAIEAARAGESGRGFAVVADEVRNLSKRTTESTQEIYSTIDTLKDSTKTVVEDMNNNRDQAAKGVELANQADGSLHSITESVDGTKESNDKMLASALKSQQVISEITTSFVGVKDAIDNIMASAKDSISDSADLTQTASLLQNVTTGFGVASACNYNASGDSDSGNSSDSSSSNNSSDDDVELF